MDYRLIWTDTAISDLQDVVKFIALDNPTAGKEVGYNIVNKIETLRDFPFSGRKVPEKEDIRIREICFNPFRLVYEIDEIKKSIYILRIWHSSRGKPFI